MGYQPRAKTPRGTSYSGRTLRERSKDKKRLRRPSKVPAQKIFPTEKEIIDATLRRLHTLGTQKFGSSPFSGHFDRWLSTVKTVLDEFKSHPSMGVDEQFLGECSQAFDVVKLQLEDRRRKEAAVEQEIKNIAFFRSSLNQIDLEYAEAMTALKSKRNRQTKPLYASIDSLKAELDKVIQMKTGILHGISKKGREQKEAALTAQISDIQRELELLLLDFSAQKKQLQNGFDAKRQPVLWQIKGFQKKIGDLETDGSLEERWFACEALIDAINGYLQRKAAKRL
ncbi:MAG: hypothetical protein NWE93_14845 [Candidatus Bathyarchaeota archaeon]|nr:hypothetical protein [Candidatus Bathyarchaeota archaeon]